MKWLCRLCGYIINNGRCTLDPNLARYRCDGCGVPDAWTPLP